MSECLDYLDYLDYQEFVDANDTPVFRINDNIEDLTLAFPDNTEYIIQRFYDFITPDDYAIFMNSSGEILICFGNPDGDNNNHDGEVFHVNKRIWFKHANNFNFNSYTLVAEYSGDVRLRKDKYPQTVILPYAFKQ